MRVAHIADTHLGYRSATIPGRDEDFALSWKTACRQIVDAKPDMILHAGDVFHRPNPSWSALSHFLDGFAILEEAKVPTFIISGNHDSSRIATKHTVFSILDGITPSAIVSYEDSPRVHHLEGLGVDVVLLSHQALLSKTLRVELESTLVGLGNAVYTILVSHGDVGDLEQSKELGSVVIPDFVFDYPWSYIALGHLHVAQPFGRNGWYSGSIERCGWSDAPASPAWTLTTLSPSGARHEQRALPALPMIQLPELDCTGDREEDIGSSVMRMLSRVEVPEGRSVSRVKLKGVHLFKRRAVQSSLQRIVKTRYPNLLFQVEVENQSSIWDNAIEDRPRDEPMRSIEDMFKDFVATRTFEDPDIPAKLMEKGMEALSKVRAAETERDSA